MEKEREIATWIIEKFEELLQLRGIKIPSDDRTGDKTEACIFGSEYYELEDQITNILEKEML